MRSVISECLWAQPASPSHTHMKSSSHAATATHSTPSLLLLRSLPQQQHRCFSPLSNNPASSKNLSDFSSFVCSLFVAEFPLHPMGPELVLLCSLFGVLLGQGKLTTGLQPLLGARDSHECALKNKQIADKKGETDFDTGLVEACDVGSSSCCCKSAQT